MPSSPGCVFADMLSHPPAAQSALCLGQVPDESCVAQGRSSKDQPSFSLPGSSPPRSSRHGMCESCRLRRAGGEKQPSNPRWVQRDLVSFSKDLA